MTCTAVTHSDAVNRAWHTLSPLPSCEGLAYANCPHCHSTLCKQLPVTRWWANRRHDCIRVETSDGHQTVYELDGDRIVDFDDEVFARAVFAEWTDERRCQGWDVSRDAAMEACGEAYERKERAA